MRAFKVFVFGLLYGWFLKLAFDRIYRENKIEDMRSENDSLREYISILETRLQGQSPATASVTRPGDQPIDIAMPTPAGKDDLKIIKGIGPAIEKKLNNAGIETFDALAQLTVPELEEILGSTRRLVQSEESLIAQAKEFAGRK